MLPLANEPAPSPSAVARVVATTTDISHRSPGMLPPSCLPAVPPLPPQPGLEEALGDPALLHTPFRGLGGAGKGQWQREAGRGDGLRGGKAPLGWPLAWAARPRSTGLRDGRGSSSSSSSSISSSCSSSARVMAEDGPKPTQLTMPLVLDQDLTKQMRLRVESLKQRGEKRQDGEKLLRPAEAVYRIDFIQQQRLQFERWDVVLDKPGKVTITGTSQNWTPDLTNLMTRQLLDPAAIFWRKEASEAMDWNEADALEFGERLSELARIRRVMYFLISFGEGVEPADLRASVVFNQL
uniref:Olfactory marker protein n=1 Tax=Sus scrofa TaxID=9823 RepID=A0A8D0YEB6_PIG